MTKYSEVRNFRADHKVLVKPLTIEELKANSTKDDVIKEKLYIDFNDLVNNDNEWLNDEVSERITGSIVGLMDIDYKLVGRTTINQAIVKVTATINYDGLE